MFLTPPPLPSYDIIVFFIYFFNSNDLFLIKTRHNIVK